MNSSLTPNFKYKKVLVIDDNEIDRYICDRISKTFRLSEVVVGVESATEGLDYLFSLEKTPDELPELIFLDINMPGMNGFEFLEAYKGLPEVIKKTCIIVMLTSSNVDQTRINGNAYVKGYLNKPLTQGKIDDILKPQINMDSIG